jgi:hypothetical protein
MSVLAPVERREYDDILSSLKVQLSEEEFAAAWNRRRKMTLKEAVAYALGEYAKTH